MPLSPPTGHPLPFGRLQRQPNAIDDGLRVDFEKEDFDEAIAAHGYRLAWQRRADCPCEPVSYQLTQPDPNCPLCEGTGYLYFGPDERQDLSGETFNEVQWVVVNDPKSFLIRGILQPITTRDRRNDKLGSWLFGETSLTVAPDNRLGFRDRFINLDVVMTYTEVAIMPAPPVLRLPLRYVVVEGVYLCQDASGRRYRVGDDFVLTAGKLDFLPGKAPAPGVRMAVHYLTYPSYLCENHSHRDRIQNAVDPDQDSDWGMGTEGYIQRLPTQATLSLEFIPSDANNGGR